MDKNVNRKKMITGYLILYLIFLILAAPIFYNAFLLRDVSILVTPNNISWFVGTVLMSIGLILLLARNKR